MNIYLRKANKQDKRMWVLNYIKCVCVGGSHMPTMMSLLSTHDADGG